MSHPAASTSTSSLAARLLGDDPCRAELEELQGPAETKTTLWFLDLMSQDIAQENFGDGGEICGNMDGCGASLKMGALWMDSNPFLFLPFSFFFSHSFLPFLPSFLSPYDTWLELLINRAENGYNCPMPDQSSVMLAVVTN